MFDSKTARNNVSFAGKYFLRTKLYMYYCFFRRTLRMHDVQYFFRCTHDSRQDGSVERFYMYEHIHVCICVRRYVYFLYARMHR